MSTYLYDNDVVRVFHGDYIFMNNELNAVIYSVKFDVNMGFYLRKETDAFNVTKNVYGDSFDKINMIIDTYINRAKRNMNTGIMFSGTKGSGKTLMAKLTCNKMLEYGYPVILIKERFDSDGLVNFLESIDTNFVMLFDEFEKIYSFEYENENSNSSQKPFLTFMDGTTSKANLILFTCNDLKYINTYMLNRPGRIYYHLKFNSISNDIFREYCDENLRNKEFEKDIKYLMSLMGDKFSFDILQMIVEECNVRNESPKKFIDMMNITYEESEILCNIRIDYDIEGVCIRPWYERFQLDLKNIEDNEVDIRVVSPTKAVMTKLNNIFKKNGIDIENDEYGNAMKVCFHYNSNVKYWYDENTNEFVFEPMDCMRIRYKKVSHSNFNFF